MAYVNIIERSNQNQIQTNPESRLFQDNIILIDGEIDAELATDVQNQLSYLQMKLSDSKNKKITIRIKSPGGSVYDGLGIYDLMKYLDSKGYIIETINMGFAASMAAILLMAGSKGHRKAMPHATTMVHEISSWNYGKINDMKDAMKETERLQDVINSIIRENSSEDLIKDCERKDLYLNAESAIQYNLIDSVIQ